ncbi:SDR family NAD(P)-dependent oxidoreductase [Tabrizicola sp. J26]|uniref:SDR family NAD(P)-dependent oxidoreductase n=1 Tax=Alitabrizicola rongguiensis TaxID=2909234 RepID=UPI001F2D7171|nr:SDR family NAD(P)-dependent oxidoreductase [Tabrizicola rongguiensis]MCF1710554.1 SDR family NAD(P)-dependent oxidoreductase [Tabrizicola rongguiensis]
MRDFRGQRYWLVGASEGLGAALARRLSAAGVDLVLSARNASRLAEVAAELPGKAETWALDVSDAAAVRDAAQKIGPVDGVVWLAALYWPMRAQDWDADQVEVMCDVNFTGCARVIGAVLPGMVARDRGHVLIVGSLSGFRGLPGAIGYGPSKAGVMALAESLHADLRGSGVTVQLANPGFIKTRLTDKNDFSMPFLMTPEEAADHVFRLMSGRRFSSSFPIPFAWLFRVSQFLPDWLYYRLFAPRPR